MVGIGFISFIGLVDSGIIRRMPDAAGITVPVSLGAGGHLLGPALVFYLFGLFFTIALFIRNVKGGRSCGCARLTALSPILEAVVPSPVKEAGNRLVLNALPGGHEVHHPRTSPPIGSADLFGAFTHRSLAASLLVFTILLSVFFDAMGVSVVLPPRLAPMKDGKVEDIDKVLLVDAFGSVVGGGASGSANQIFVSPLPVLVQVHAPALNIVTGVLFLLAIFISPLVTIVPFEAVAPALVVVGFLMIRQARE